jgi:hypothetical protein
VIACVSAATGAWTLERHPDPAQLTAASRADALHTAVRFAAEAAVDVWVCHADSSFELLATYRAARAARFD